MPATARSRANLRVLRAAPIFRTLDEGTLQSLVAGCRYLTHGAGGVVRGFTAGGDSICAITAGSVRLSLLSEGGREFLLQEPGQGEVFPLRETSSNSGVAILCTAAEDGTVIYLFDMDLIVELCPSHAQLAVDLVRLLGRQAADLQQLLGEQAFCTLRQRLARKLAQLSARPGATVSYTREDIARMLGTTREPATRALHELRDEGLIRYEPRGREIVVLDPERLERLATS